MNCDDLRLDLSAYADGELDVADAARVEAHVAGCFSCRERLESWQAVSASLRDADATRDPSASIVAALRARPRPCLARRARFRLGLRAAIAAAVVGATLLSLGPVQAQREAAELVDLDARVRLGATEELATVEAAQLELLALFLSLDALESGGLEARELEREASRIAVRAAAIKARLRELHEALDREALLGAAPGAHGPERE